MFMNSVTNHTLFMNKKATGNNNAGGFFIVCLS